MGVQFAMKVGIWQDLRQLMVSQNTLIKKMARKKYDHRERDDQDPQSNCKFVTTYIQFSLNGKLMLVISILYKY